MNNKILVILLSFILSYTANASNENEQITGTITGYDRLQLREQIERAWPNIQPALTLSQDTNDATSARVAGSSDKSNKYIIISFSPTPLDRHTPMSEITAVSPRGEMEGLISLHTEFAQDIEAALGLRKDALRFEGGLKWTRFHTGHTVPYYYRVEPSPFGFYDDIGPFDYRETIDNLGAFVGAAYDIRDLFYIGGKIGLLRASLGDVVNGYHDLTSFYQVDIGIIKELTPQLDLLVGYTHSQNNEANFGSPYGNASLGPVKRNYIRTSLLFSIGD